MCNMSKKKSFHPKITKLNHICSVVRDLDKAIQTYEDVYGIDPWEMGGKEDFKYLPGITYVHGKQHDFRGRLAICNALHFAIEPIQPMDEKSHYAEFLREHGEGLHLSMVDIAVKSFVQTVEDRGNEAIFHGYCSGPPFTEKTPCI